MKKLRCIKTTEEEWKSEENEVWLTHDVEVVADGGVLGVEPGSAAAVPARMRAPQSRPAQRGRAALRLVAGLQWRRRTNAHTHTYNRCLTNLGITSLVILTILREDDILFVIFRNLQS